jgi:prolipoprotein diacylglyceryltransferase
VLSKILFLFSFSRKSCLSCLAYIRFVGTWRFLNDRFTDVNEKWDEYNDMGSIYILSVICLVSFAIIWVFNTKKWINLIRL